jgi:uncharacterized membrane protein YjfL (UPF0719 family)
METIITSLEQTGIGSVFAILLSVLLIGVAFLRDFLVKEYKTIDEIVFKKNFAPAIRLAGVALGISLGMAGFMGGGTTVDFLAELKTLGLEGGIMVVMIMLSALIADRVILRGINNNQAVAEGNSAVAIVELGAFVSTGLIAWGSFSGEGGGLLSSVVFFVLGQTILILVAALYQKRTRFDSIEFIKKGSNPAALMLAGTMIAMAIIMRGAISGNFVSWPVDLATFAISIVAGYILLWIVTELVDWKLIPVKRVVDVIEEDNIGAIFMTVAFNIGAAVIIGMAI